MGSTIEKLDKNEVKMTLIIDADSFEEGMKHSYNKNRQKINLPGFRKGKAPRALLEKQFGKEIFFDDAIDFVFSDAFEQAAEEHGLEPVDRPVLDSTEYDPEKGMTLGITVTVKPEVKLGEYKGIRFNDYDFEVTDEEVNTEIDKDREKNARVMSISDRPIEKGDTAVIDFEGFIDGAPFEGGKGEDYNLVIGSGSFIDTFEEQLIGTNVGDDLEINVTFPEDYHEEKFAGKPAMFAVEIKDITKKELPEPDDEFAQDVSEFDTFVEYKNNLRDKLIHQKEHKKEHDIEDEIIKKVCENAEVDIPSAMVERDMSRMVQEFANRLASQGLELSVFLQYSGQTVEAFREGYRESSERNVKARLVLEAVANAESIVPTEEEVQAELARIAESYGIEEDKVKSVMRKEDIKGLELDLKTQAALKILIENAVAEKE